MSAYGGHLDFFLFMKLRYIIAVAVIFALAVLRFSPGLAPHAVETRHEPVAIKARERDRQSPQFLSPLHSIPRSKPSLEATRSFGVDLGSTAALIEAPAALGISKPASSAISKGTGNTRHASARFPTIDPAKYPLVSDPTVDTDHTESASSTETSTVTAQNPVPQPASWADLGGASTLTPEQDREVQQMAEELTEQLSHSGLDPASQEYRSLWNDLVRESDFIFMQRYGGEAWEAHHIQAYHLAHGEY